MKNLRGWYLAPMWQNFKKERQKEREETIKKGCGWEWKLCRGIISRFCSSVWLCWLINRCWEWWWSCCWCCYRRVRFPFWGGFIVCFWREWFSSWVRYWWDFGLRFCIWTWVIVVRLRFAVWVPCTERGWTWRRVGLYIWNSGRFGIVGGVIRNAHAK